MRLYQQDKLIMRPRKERFKQGSICRGEPKRRKLVHHQNCIVSIESYLAEDGVWLAMVEGVPGFPAREGEAIGVVALEG